MKIISAGFGPALALMKRRAKGEGSRKTDRIGRKK